VPKVTDRLRDAVQERVSREVLPVVGEHFSTVVKDARPFLLVLSRVLRRATDARHGGAFIFPPPTPSATKDFGLKILYPTTDLDLGGDLVKQWQAHGDVAKNHGEPQVEAAIRRAEICRCTILTDSEAVANFSAVDGCVVLTQDLRVLGF